jgi:hypothetical protein
MRCTRIGALRVEGWPHEDRGIKASFYLTPKMDCTLEMRQVGWAHIAGTASVPIENCLTIGVHPKNVCRMCANQHLPDRRFPRPA